MTQSSISTILGSVSKVVTLTSSSWSTAVPYSYTLTGMAARTTTNLVHIIPNSNCTIAQMKSFTDALITRAEWTNTTTLVLYAYGTKPTVNIPIKVVVDKR